MVNNIILLENVNKKKQKKATIDALPIEGGINKKNTINAKEKNNVNFNIIKINLNNTKKYTPQNPLIILNNYTFEEAIKYDMRSICAIFYIFLLSKQATMHTFLYKSPLESFQIRFCLLLFVISSDLALNAIFYLDDLISKKKIILKIYFTFNNNIL